MNQNSVDDLLAQVESNADAVKALGTANAAEEILDAAAGMNEIAGEMEAPESSTVQELPFTAPGGEVAAHEAAPIFSSLGGPDLHRLLAIEVPVIVQLGIRRMSVGEVMRLGVGVILEFNKSAEEELDLLANNKAIGKGHAVKVGENFGIKISKIGSVKETIRKLGGI